MNFTHQQQIPSLQHIAFVKITVVLWTQNDIETLMGNFVYPGAHDNMLEKWQKIENQVTANVPKILPKTLKYKILDLIKPIGLQLLDWLKCYPDLRLKSQPNSLCWTNRGTVNGKTSASALIEDNSLDITVRYKLACIFCFENDIPQLWNKMSIKNKKSFYCEENPEDVKQNDLVIFWTYYLEGEVAKLTETIRWCENCTPYQFAFHRAAEGGHIEAVKYFLSKLTLEERERCLVIGTKNSMIMGFIPSTFFASLSKAGYSEVLCYLLSQMNVEQKMCVYKICGIAVLLCMLEWPCQDVFLGTADMMWNFLGGDSYNLILCKIINKVIKGYRDYNYRELFSIFWKRSPDALKKYVINTCNSSRSCLPNLFKVHDKENIRLILKDATVAIREKIIFHNNGKIICENLIDHAKWDLLNFFVQECISSKGSMIKFKELFKERSSLLTEAIEKRKNYTKFFLMLDDLIQDDGKRNIEDGDSCPAKKLCK